MNPFYPSQSNQINAQSTSLPPAMIFNPNPQFPNGPNIPPPLMNHSLVGHPQNAQNVNLAAQLGALHHNMQSMVQNQQVIALMQQGGQFWPQMNVNQMLGMFNAQVCQQRGVSLLGNPQGGIGHCSSNFGNVLLPIEATPAKNHDLQGLAALSNAGHGGMKEFSGARQLSRLPLPNSPMKGQHSGRRMPLASPNDVQVHHAKNGKPDASHGNSGNSTSNNFTKNLCRSGGRETTQMRFQKSQNYHSKNGRGLIRSSSNNGGAGQQNWRERKPQFNNTSKGAPIERKRPLPVDYTEKEIKEWREARKKNYPTSANIEKNSAGNGKSLQNTDAEAKLRRQQLKAILAQQAELGVEVAEVPPSYLSDLESHVSQTKKDRKDWKSGRKEWNKTGKFQMNRDKRRRRNQDRRHGKRPKLENEEAVKPIQKREPTLLQKLLSKEIKGDKCRLLQVFRFMVMNSFFNNWPEKPLVFPALMVRDSRTEIEIAGDKRTSQEGQSNTAYLRNTKNKMLEEIGSLNDTVAEDNGATDGEDIVVDHSTSEDNSDDDQPEISEEGEITK